jgi:hypothetical protein
LRRTTDQHGNERRRHHPDLARKRRASFFKGFITGVGSATVLSEQLKIPHRTYEGRGLRGDWLAVGDSSIRRAQSVG